MIIPESLALIAVGAVAGVVSTVASLASVVSYPALLALGLPPLSANMTNTVALLFTGAGAAAGSRPELAGQGTRVRRLGLVTALGGGAGAALLLITPAQTFVRVAPVLIAGGSLLLLRPPRRSRQDVSGRPGKRSRVLVAALFWVALYVGYFGAAGGILMLAVLAPLLAEPMARANAVKNVISGLANAVAALAFTMLGHVDWAMAVPLAAGFLLGGWAGPALVRRMPGHALRVLIGVAGLAVAAKLGISAYR